MTDGFLHSYGNGALMALGFFWKAGWAFVLGYTISSLIQTFVPRSRLTRYMGDPGFKSISLSTVFGAASSSCSFAALATARSLVLKGAHFIAAVAFMFASTNLVIELGILIFIFLGWEFLIAEITGGIVLIIISSVLIYLTYPRKWIKDGRDKVEEESDEEQDFDWKKRIKSKTGWLMVGKTYVSEWLMVWEDIFIGFTVAGFVAVFVPRTFWTHIFLSDFTETLPGWLILIENALVAPFVAAATFIGSMGNIPLATVLNANGVLFTGIMGFIYSDLMVPPLVRVNAKYYGWRVALYIALVMFISIVFTALILNGAFAFFDAVPESGKAVSDVSAFKLDYTFWLNLVMVLLTAALITLNILYKKEMKKKGDGHGGSSFWSIKKVVIPIFLVIEAAGLIAYFLTSR